MLLLDFYVPSPYLTYNCDGCITSVAVGFSYLRTVTG